MPALDDPRRESYCQNIVLGHSKREAFRQAGYSVKSDSGATKVSQRPEVIERISELRAENLKRVQRKTAYTRDWVIATLIDTVKEAQDDRKHREVILALEKLGSELGMFIRKSETTTRAEVPESKEQVRAEITSLLGRVLGVDEADIKKAADAKSVGPGTGIIGEAPKH